MGLMDFLKKIGVVKSGVYSGTGEEIAGMNADMAMMNNGQEEAAPAEAPVSEAPAMSEPVAPVAPAPEAPVMSEPVAPAAPAPEAPAMPETTDTPMA